MGIIKWFFLERSCHIQFPLGIEITAPPFFVLLALIAYVMSIIRVARDATRRGKNGFLAGLMVALLLWPASLLLWLWLRPKAQPTS